jgi:uncharacterized protein
VGKSHLIRAWGKSSFDSFAELNFERDPGLAEAFADNEPRVTVRRLEAVTRQRISLDGSALLFLDEVQAAPAVLAKLRWFSEELPQLPIVAAGSLLDFALESPTFSMPVGRVSFMHLEPMGFLEFLDAMGEGMLLKAFSEELTRQNLKLRQGNWQPLHQRLMDLFSQFVIVGGMPAAVKAYAREGSLLSVSEIHGDLLAAFRSDFSKYAGLAHQTRLNKILSSVPHQLGNKFRYARADPDDRASPLKHALELLCLARVCHQVVASDATSPPLGANSNDKAFKVLLLDTGLVSSLAGLSLVGVMPSADLMLAHRGGLAEQAVGQLLRLLPPSHEQPSLFYWQRQASGAEAEVDFVIQNGPRLVPVEVKSGSTGTLRSLHMFMAERRLPLAVRFNADPPSLVQVEANTAAGVASYQLLSLPLYAVELLPALLRDLQFAAAQPL